MTRQGATQVSCGVVSDNPARLWTVSPILPHFMSPPREKYLLFSVCHGLVDLGYLNGGDISIHWLSHPSLSHISILSWTFLVISRNIRYPLMMLVQGRSLPCHTNACALPVLNPFVFPWWLNSALMAKYKQQYKQHHIFIWYIILCIFYICLYDSKNICWMFKKLGDLKKDIL